MQGTALPHKKQGIRASAAATAGRESGEESFIMQQSTSQGLKYPLEKYKMLSVKSKAIRWGKSPCRAAPAGPLAKRAGKEQNDGSYQIQRDEIHPPGCAAGDRGIPGSSPPGPKRPKAAGSWRIFLRSIPDWMTNSALRRGWRRFATRWIPGMNSTMRRTISSIRRAPAWQRPAGAVPGHCWPAPTRKVWPQSAAISCCRRWRLPPPSASEEVLELMQQENALASRYQKLYAGGQVQFDGKSLTLP